MKKFRQLMLTAVIIGSVLTTTTAAESFSVLLQKGIFAEETEGNLDAAIKIYEQIAAEAAINRPVAAQAQYRLAVCYQKKGNKEQAIKILNELLQQFPSDVALTRKARGTLAELGAAPPEAVSVRKIPLPVATGGLLVSVSLDGRLEAYQPKDSHDLVVCEMATGKTWTIAKGSKESSSWFAPQFSPDGQWIAYDFSAATITVLKVDGSEARKLYQGDREKEELWPVGWSRDAKYVIVKSRPPLEGQTNSVNSLDSLIVALDVKTGAKKEIARVSKVDGQSDKYTLLGEPGFVWGDNVVVWEGHYISASRFSADGQYLARGSGPYPRGITLLDLKSGREETVVGQDAGYVFGWFSGDTKLVFSRYRVGGTDIMAIGVKDGKPTGERNRLWSFLQEVSPVGITREGSIYYVTQDGSLWVMEGLLTSKPTDAYQQFYSESIMEAEIAGPNHLIFDRKFDLSATYPAGWTILSAGRFLTSGENQINFAPPEAPGSFLALRYVAATPGDIPEGGVLSWSNALGPKPTTPAEVDSWLRKYAQRKAEHANKTDYMVRPASIVLRNVGGHRAVSVLADFTNNGEAWTEYLTCIIGEKVIALLRIQTQTSKIDALRPAVDEMIETLRMP